MKSRVLKGMGLFVLSALIMLVLSLVRSDNDKDKHYWRTAIARGQQLHCRVDIGTEGEIKYLLQPNLYTIMLRLEPEEKQAKLYCATEGMEILASQSSKKGLWKRLESKELLRYVRGCIPLCLEVYLPKSQLKRHRVQEGRVVLYDDQGEYAVIRLEIVNSRYQDVSSIGM